MFTHLTPEDFHKNQKLVNSRLTPENLHPLLQLTPELKIQFCSVAQRSVEDYIIGNYIEANALIIGDHVNTLTIGGTLPVGRGFKNGYRREHYSIKHWLDDEQAPVIVNLPYLKEDYPCLEHYHGSLLIRLVEILYHLDYDARWRILGFYDKQLIEDLRKKKEVIKDNFCKLVDLYTNLGPVHQNPETKKFNTTKHLSTSELMCDFNTFLLTHKDEFS